MADKKNRQTLKNIGYTGKQDKIATYIGQLGAMYLEHNKQYKNLLSEHIVKTTEKITIDFYYF